jgi:hypothetical protein
LSGRSDRWLISWKLAQTTGSLADGNVNPSEWWGYVTDGVSSTYDVEVMTGGAVAFTANVSSTSYQPTTNALNNASYTWRVQARQDSATGPWSAEATFRTQSPRPVDS